MSGQTRWMWFRLDMEHFTVGTGYVYDVSTVLTTFYERELKAVSFIAVKALPVSCQFVIPYQLYNGKDGCCLGWQYVFNCIL